MRTSKKSLAAGALVLFATAINVAAITPASAAANASPVRGWKNVSTLQCLDTHGSDAYTNACNTGSYQKWYTIDLGSSLFQLQNVNTGKCLDTHGNDAYTYTCNTGTYQKWKATKYTYGYEFKNVATGQCLDTHGGDAYTRACNGGNYERWSSINY
jgi:hypothetical protein